ncbi:alpha-galactosidase [Paenibacillus montaniterrae]|uniref:Alpha-galactosidase n=1 Tax=Paenibacillus montaniterrae TaxID=429341 RepID=A0A920CX42_9BACL|nr:alpha-galactosidase [Paenibacillus montaniterrae]GIP16521.1 alpha-galactosidase [Paenibacillus montaniterrae]
MITYNEATRIFHLRSLDTSYILKVTDQGNLAHLYWGRAISDTDLSHLYKRMIRPSFTPNPDLNELDYSLDTLQQELPAYGNSDFRTPAYQFQLPNGSTVTNFLYESHEIVAGKPQLQGLPAVYVEATDEAQTLLITLRDELTNAAIVLTYTVFRDYAAITRSVQYRNDGSEVLNLTRALSMSVDLPAYNYEMLHLSGTWIRERHVHRRKLEPGMQSIESRRGASSHAQNPFLALVSEGATEQVGDVYGINLVYSGNFIAGVEVDPYHHSRLFMGINPFDFNWKLEAGESFQAPEVVMVHSYEGIGGMSRRFHDLYRKRLIRGQFRDQVRPILVNNWEATYFDFNEQKLEKIVKAGKELGIELFVLDDGWFGKRNDDTTSLGDWVVDTDKLPNGLHGIVSKVREQEMQFGLWFEPEMVSPESELYRQHPDWCLHVEGRRRTQARQQLVLDLSRQDVQNYIISAVSDILASAPITYVKWDMNRNMTEIGSALLPADRQRETAHRYMLGLYHVLESITSAFPHVLFESCSGGGGRFDAGMLYYMPQTWTSDNSDAISRLKIQYGTSIVYPVSSMGAHVSAVPNHQVNRVTSLLTRGNVALSGNFGYELDLSTFTDEEKELVKYQVELYKQIRPIVQFGDFYRLLSPFEGNDTAWMFVSKDKNEAFVVYVKVLQEPNGAIGRFRLQGLDPDKVYEVFEGQDKGEYSGSHLLYAGLAIPRFYGDFQSCVYRLKAKQ